MGHGRDPARGRRREAALSGGIRSGIATETDPPEEADLPAAFEFPNLEPQRLLDRRVINVVAGVALAIAVVVWPERSDRLLVALIGLALVIAFASSAWEVRRVRPVRWGTLAIAAVGIGFGAYFLLAPGRSIVTVGRVTAIVLAVAASLDLVRQFRRPPGQRSWPWPLAKALAGIGTASLIAAYPTQLLALATATVALGWAVLSVIGIVQTITSTDERAWRVEESGDVVLEWLRERPKDLEDRRALYEKVLYEGPRLRQRVVRFVTLMSFASVIAAMGVITDSTAVVIGAMLIAPLMTPLMGIAISVVMGWPNRLNRSASIALLGVLIAIAIGIVLGLVAPTAIDPATNGQIVARASPTTLDLITAVAAGAAGAYGLSRPDVSDSLPGVAIAISLVPPLSAVGISYSQAAWEQGNGALLLFLTNALAIVIVGGITFVFTGVTPIQRVARNQQRVRTTSASLIALGSLVVGALVINGAEITTNALEVTSVEQALADWADDNEEYSFVSVDISGDDVLVVILGPLAGRPPAEELHAIVTDELGRDAMVTVRLIVEEVEVFPEP